MPAPVSISSTRACVFASTLSVALRVAEEVGQRVDEAQHQRDGDDDVLPEGVAIHDFLNAMKAASGRLRA
jgi:hypothetical protein